MEKALITVSDSSFVKGTACLLKSLLYHNKRIDYRIIILDAGLKEKDKEKLNQIFDNLEYVKPRIKNYESFLNKVPNHFKKAFYKLDIFGFDFLDRIVYLDSDMLILGDISYLFTLEEPFSACSSYGEQKEKFDTRLNSGMFVLNNPNKDLYNNLISESFSKKVRYDQDVLRQHFPNYNKLDSPKWNYKKHIYASEEWRYKFDIKKNIKIIHYISKKPWQDLSKDSYFNKLKPLYNLWNFYYEK